MLNLKVLVKVMMLQFQYIL